MARLPILLAEVLGMFLAFAISVLTCPCGILGGEAKVTALAGGPGDFLHAAYVRIDGSSFEIGRELARLGSERHGSKPPKAKAQDRIREQRAYFAEHWPAQIERMRGVAEYFGVELDSDELELDSVAYSGVSAGCTVVFYPPRSTEDGRAVLARNFDFTTGTMDRRLPKDGDPAACASPYVLELHPTDALASLALVAFDLLGVVDGINSAGLTVALLADDELFATGQARPSGGARAGLDVLQVGRFLLDTCKDVEEAKSALQGLALYYTSIPCHYLIADAAGHAFIWENAADLASGHVVAAEHGGPLVSTNYLRHLHPDGIGTADDPDPDGLFARERTLEERFEQQGKFSLDEIRANATCVAACARPDPGSAPGRTLWRAFYFPSERRMEVDFYLGEGESGPRRSPSTPLSLEPR